MTSYDSERISIADEVRKRLAVADTLTTIQARSFVRCLQTTWQVPTIAWGKKESYRQLADARRLLHCANIYRDIEGPSERALLCYRRAAELLEWLLRSSDMLDLVVPIELLAAGAYQLADLPAMASSLLSLVDISDNGTHLFASFLKADFDAVIYYISDFWSKNPESRECSATEKLLLSRGTDTIEWYITVELVRSLGLIADSLRRGDDERLNLALEKLYALDSLATRKFSDDVSMLISLLSETANKYRYTSVYLPVKQLAQNTGKNELWLLTYARRLFSRGRGILWPSQRRGLNKLLRDRSFALCTPTGSGKTLVANFALIKELLLLDDEGFAPLGLYLVPSRALAGEVEAKLSDELGNYFIVTGLYGGADWGITDYWLNAERPTVLIATVEKADALMRYIGPLLFARLRLLIIDEAHQVLTEERKEILQSYAEHSNRSIRLETFVTRIMTQAPSVARIALTAVAGGASELVAKWMEGQEDARAIGEHYRSTRKLVGKLEAYPDAPGIILIDLMNDHPLYVHGREDLVYLKLRTPKMPQFPRIMGNSIYRFNELFILWTALHLVNDNRRILISIAQKPEQTMGWYKDALELKDWHDAVTFSPPDDSRRLEIFNNARAACIDYCGEDSLELFLLDRGIVCNYGQMPQRLRRLMTMLIFRGVCPITVATSTLTEGVNLPFDLILVSTVTRDHFDPEERKLVKNHISASEFHNLAGRAGRPGSPNGIEGVTLISIPQKPSATAKSTRRVQRRQIRKMESAYQVLRSSLLENQTAEVSNSPLSLLIRYIASSAKEYCGVKDDQFVEWLEVITPTEISEDAGTGSHSSVVQLADSIDELDSIFLNTLEEHSRVLDRVLDGATAEALLVNYWKNTFAQVAEVQEAILEQAFIRRGRAFVEKTYPDEAERRRLYHYGFPPYLGRRFHQIVPDIHARISAATDYGNMDSRQRLNVFECLGSVISDDRGYGFFVSESLSDQEILRQWRNVLAWWMQVGDNQVPDPGLLRKWQRFVADNLEFRLGVAIGSVIALAWSDGANDPLEVPSLKNWRETTRLPWFGFWAKELLRWGTLDPLVAFLMAQGHAQTRSEAARRRTDYNSWLMETYGRNNAEDLIDPRLFLEWEDQKFLQVNPDKTISPIKVDLIGTAGKLGCYNVIPIIEETNVCWIDASGFELARSQLQQDQLSQGAYRNDYELRVQKGSSFVTQRRQ